MSNVLAGARAWAAAGFGVIPIRADGTKRPALSAWEPYQHRRATEAELQEWFGLDRVGVAVICGAVSDNLEVLDFDDPDVWPEYEAACSAHDLGAVLTRCPLAETPSGGRHVLYRCAVAVEGNQKLALYADGRKARIETRGEGGYAVAPPSGRACHEAGKPYRFLRGRPNTVQTLTVDERCGLLAVARMFDLAEPEAWAASPARSAGPQDCDRPGDAYNETDAYASELVGAGWQRAGTSGEWQLWRRPGKTGPGHSAKSGTWQGRRCFVNYSSSVPEFTEKRGYSPFAVYAILCHGGDFVAAATALSGAVPNRREPRGAEAGPPSPVAPQAPQVGQPAGETGITQDTAPFVGVPSAQVVCLADVKAERVRWLWQDRIPLGKTTLLDGDPSVGKSTVTVWLAARLSRGEPLPGDVVRPAASSLFLSCEDGLADTMRPRLDAAGADPHRVYALTGVTRGSDGFTSPAVIPNDCDALEDVIRQRRVALCVIDPLMAFLSSDCNSHRDQDVRRALARLSALAERTDCAVVMIRHLNKMGGGPAIYRGGGSIGILGAARSALLVGKDPNDPDIRVIAPLKHNLCREPGALSFRLKDSGAGVAVLEWIGETNITAQDLVNGAGAEPAEARAEAEALLREALCDGPRLSRDVERELTQAGVTVATLRRAKRSAGVGAYRRGFGDTGQWWLELPPATMSPKSISTSDGDCDRITGSIDAHTPEVSALAP